VKKNSRAQKDAGLIKTMSKVGRCYYHLVKEFIVNVNPEVDAKGHIDFRKVYMRGKCVKFSAFVINKYLGRSYPTETEDEVSLNEVVKEITVVQVKKWPQ
jgi:hypothetical protein